MSFFQRTTSVVDVAVERSINGLTPALSSPSLSCSLPLENGNKNAGCLDLETHKRVRRLLEDERHRVRVGFEVFLEGREVFDVEKKEKKGGGERVRRKSLFSTSFFLSLLSPFPLNKDEPATSLPGAPHPKGARPDALEKSQFVID